MFFGLTNLSAIFQAMINDILRDLINTGDVVVFMDNVLVGTEEEEKHNQIVEKVLRRIVSATDCRASIKPTALFRVRRELNGVLA